MKTIFSFFLILTYSICSAQNIPSEFVVTKVNKKVKEFPDTLDLSTPIKSCVTLSYVNINGKESLLSKVSTIKYKYSFSDSDNPKVEESFKAYLLNTSIIESSIYKDSIACVISQQPDSSFSIRSFYLEQGNWVNAGENVRKTLTEARESFKERSNMLLQNLRQINLISKLPTDTIQFVNYINENGKDLLQFVLNKLVNYKLVMYGEIHRRKVSWDFLQNVIKNDLFVENTGVIFIEMESNKQSELDRFYANDTIDKELLLNFFRDYSENGWDDKGKFDFLISVWKINKQLPLAKRIKVVAVDTPRDFSEVRKKNYITNRDEFMANTILTYFNTTQDQRNGFFIVGAAHVAKTRESAGMFLIRKMPNDCYAIFTHCPRVDNYIKIPERIRGGMFDYAFYYNGDKPVAFELKKSPFGQEAFDGLYLDGTGTYQDNFDGYVFFGSLDKEPNAEPLYDMYDEKFVKEMDRRYRTSGRSLEKVWEINETSQKAVIEFIKSKQTPLRWENVIKSLKLDNIKIIK